MQEAEIDSYDQFIVLFRERYWSANTQRTAKRNIEIGQYSPGGKMTCVEYATNLFGLRKELDLEYTETEFVLRISEHFERNIRHTVLGQQVKDKNMLLKILTAFDGDDQRHRKYDKFNSQNKLYTPTETANASNQQTFDKANMWSSKNVNATSKQKSILSGAKDNSMHSNHKFNEQKNAQRRNKELIRSYDSIDICNKDSETNFVPQGSKDSGNAY